MLKRHAESVSCNWLYWADFEWTKERLFLCTVSFLNCRSVTFQHRVGNNTMPNCGLQRTSLKTLKAWGRILRTFERKTYGENFRYSHCLIESVTGCLDMHHKSSCTHEQLLKRTGKSIAGIASPSRKVPLDKVSRSLFSPLTNEGTAAAVAAVQTTDLVNSFCRLEMPDQESR